MQCWATSDIYEFDQVGVLLKSGGQRRFRLCFKLPLARIDLLFRRSTHFGGLAQIPRNEAQVPGQENYLRPIRYFAHGRDPRFVTTKEPILTSWQITQIIARLYTKPLSISSSS
jgi:hypothetical protein